MSKKFIYLSPSKQPGNIYATGTTNEEVQMTLLAEALHKKLQNYEVQSMISTYDRTVVTLTHRGLPGRTAEAQDFDADLYLALHSNAAPPAQKGKAQGVQVYISSISAEADKLSRQLLAEIRKISPKLEGVPHHKNSYIVHGNNYAEVRFPESVGITGVLLEVEFHDNVTLAQWIVDYIDPLADSILTALVNHYKLKKREQETTLRRYDYNRIFHMPIAIQGYNLPNFAGGIAAVKFANELLATTERVDRSDGVSFVRDAGNGAWYMIKLNEQRWQVSGGWTSPLSGKNEYWRVREEWNRPATQKGAYKDLDNAVKFVMENPDYKVFTPSGQEVRI